MMECKEISRATQQEADMKKFIADSSYEKLLRVSRFAPVGDPLFSGAIGDLYMRTLREKRSSLPQGESARISKEIGWG